MSQSDTVKDNYGLKVITPISIFGAVEKYSLLKSFPACIETHENFQKRSMRNRTIILSANGPLCLSIPLQKGKTKQRITDVSISYAENWMKDYLESIRSAYANAPYFEFYFPAVEGIIAEQPIRLMDLFESSFAFIQKHINIKGHSYTEEFKSEYSGDVDLRNIKATHYIETKPYVQVFSDRFDFVNKLSILDILFNLGPESDAHLGSALLGTALFKNMNRNHV